LSLLNSVLQYSRLDGIITTMKTVQYSV